MGEWNFMCCNGGAATRLPARELEPFSLATPLPEWPQGTGFSKCIICLGELEVAQVTTFQKIWSRLQSNPDRIVTSFYKPLGVPDGFFVLGHYGQPSNRPLEGFVLVAREVGASNFKNASALCQPEDYTLVWTSDNLSEDDNMANGGYFWLPCPPEGYKALGYVVTEGPAKPSLEDIRCVRSDLTDTCEGHELMLHIDSMVSDLRVWSTRPCSRGIRAKGVSVGTFYCATYGSHASITEISCLKNLDSTTLHAMPNMEQIRAIVIHYGPTIFFHPKERYFPSSVSWFFQNGATLCKKMKDVGEPIDANGLNLPSGGTNDGEYWIDLPEHDRNDSCKRGCLEDSELYVHVKPALGGTFTDLAFWVFCPFNGPATLRIGILSFELSKIGQHVGDWEHFTLRISNFSGELWGIYFSQHSGGKWVRASGLEFLEGNKAIIYSSKHGHASFPHAGNYLQGSEKLGIGVRNDAARSKYSLDSSVKYQIISAEYLGHTIEEPPWLQYMREWGPTIVYSSKSELEKLLSFLPVNLRSSVASVFSKLPLELYGEEGPTGPKEKNNWTGDERS